MANMVDVYSHKPEIGRVALVSLIVVCVAAMISTLWPAIHVAWTNSSGYSHGYLILILAVWLVIQESKQSPRIQLAPSAPGLIALVIAIVGAVVGLAADVMLIQQAAIPALAASALWSVSGLSAVRRFLAPVVLSLFAVPIWELLNDGLRDLATAVVGSLVRLVSIPANIQGNFIAIPAGVFEIAGGCSGLHYFVVSCALGTLYGVMISEKWSLRFVTILTAAFLALIANWLRIFTIIVAGHASDMQHYLVTVDHYYFGWILFVVLLTPLFLFGRRFGEPSKGPNETPGAAMTDSPCRLSYWAKTKMALLVFVATAGVVISVLVSSYPAVSEGSEERVLELPSLVPEWSSHGAWDRSTRPRFINADDEISGRFVRSAQPVEIYAAHYQNQGQGRELINFQNMLITPGSEILARSTKNVVFSDGRVLGMTELETRNQVSSVRLSWYSYIVADRSASTPLQAKLYQVMGLIQGRRDGQVLVLSSPCDPDCNGARGALTQFSRDVSLARILDAQ